MLRDLLADFAMWRSERLVTCSEWWSDVAMWVTHADTWADIRARRMPLRREPT